MANNIEWADIAGPFGPAIYHRPALEVTDPDDRLLDFDWDAALGLGDTMIYAEGPDSLQKLAQWFTECADRLRSLAATTNSDDTQGSVEVFTDVSEHDQIHSHQNATLALTAGGLAVSIEVDAASNEFADTATDTERLAAQLKTLLSRTGLRTRVYIGPADEENED